MIIKPAKPITKTLIVNRFNDMHLLDIFEYYQCNTNIYSRWQVSVRINGVYHDYYFAAKPTRKQVSRLLQGKEVK